jgi:modulator of FtsH protease HflK
MKMLRWLMALLAVGYLCTGISEIRPEERAVVKRFGRIVARPGPGLWIGLPWGMDRVERVPIAQVRRVTVGYAGEGDEAALAAPAGLLLTGDENLVTLRVHVDFAVAEGETALDDFVLHRDRLEGIVARETEAALTEWASGQAIDSILLTGSGELPRWLVPRLQERIEPYRLGVRIQNASVALLTPPDEVKRDFERVNQAEAVNRTRVSRARQEEAQRHREAESAEYRLRLEARAYAEAAVALAHTEADAFRQRLAQYQRMRRDHPDVLSLIWWDELSKVFLGLKERGRVDLLDQYLGPDGLDLSTIVPPVKRRQ